ncbi:saccharopine dehydrogenase (NADP+, L-glutamate-forming) [Coemansia sp. RSA 2322]|nr:saccharopine dehydrogenase (NADP+, L-glutamate-forming) [Coemansia sp. RSA 2322]
MAAEKRMSKTLQRRSMHGVRKSDIRVVAGGVDAEVRAAFAAARQSGSGGDDDICVQRLRTWGRVVANYREFFQSMVAAELDLATVYARIGDVLRVPVEESALLLGPGRGGVQAVTRRLKALQQVMVESHCAISHSTKHEALRELDALGGEVAALAAAYAGSLQPLHGELEQCSHSIRQRTQLLRAAVAAADAGAESIKDPFILGLEVDALRRKRAEVEAQLRAEAAAQQTRLAAAEAGMVERLAAVVARFVDVVGAQLKPVRVACRRDARAARRVDGTAEWAHFRREHAQALAAAAPQADAAPSGADGEWARVLRQGVVAVREQGALFRSTWQSKYGVVTTRGYFHVFRSQGDVVRGAPETSVFLARARVAVARPGTLVVSAGSRFARTRLVIQDAPESLDRWRELMAAAARQPGAAAAPRGLATPPESPALCPSRSLPATPPRGRPFSADASMLTPTQNIWMEALGARVNTQDSYRQRVGALAFSPARDSPSPGLASSSPGKDTPSPDPFSLGSPGKDMSLSPDSPCSTSSELGPLSSLPRMATRAVPRPFSSSAGAVPIGYGDIWHADVLAVPDPAYRPRPRSLIAAPSRAPAMLDPTNPYLGDLFVAHARVVSHPAASPPLHARMLPGPCASTPRGSRENILLLGSGFVAEPCLEYLLRSGNNRLTVACRRLEKAKELVYKYPDVAAISLDVEDPVALDAAVAAHDVTISLIPYTQHALVIKSAIKAKKHVVTTSYISPAMEELDAAAKHAGIICMNEIGLDPGIDHLYALKIINEVRDQGGKITSFESFCGGLPAPEDSNNPLGYKFSWSARGVLLALRNNARYWQDGDLVEIQGKDLMDSARPIYVYPAFATVGYGNRDSSFYRERYNIPHAQTCIRGTLRYQGFPEFAKTLVNMGFLDDTHHAFLAAANSAPLPWNKVTQQLLGHASDCPDDLLRAIEAKIDSQDPETRRRILHGVKWLGITSPDVLVSKRGTYLDVLCARLEDLMMYAENERDMILLQHKFEVENKDGSHNTRTSVTLMYGEPNGFSAMAKTVGVPCGIATQLILDGKITNTGIIAPMTPDIYQPIMDLLPSEGINAIEETI